MFAYDGRLPAFNRSGGFPKKFRTVIIIVVKLGDEAILSQIDGVIQAFAELIFLGELEYADFVFRVLACPLSIELDIHVIVVQDYNHLFILPELTIVILEYVVDAGGSHRTGDNSDHLSCHLHSLWVQA